MTTTRFRFGIRVLGSSGLGFRVFFGFSVLWVGVRAQTSHTTTVAIIWLCSSSAVTICYGCLAIASSLVGALHCILHVARIEPVSESHGSMQVYSMYFWPREVNLYLRCGRSISI